MTPPDPAKTLPIEQVVLDRIRRELQRCRKELGTAPRVLRAIQNTLSDPGLTVDEQKIVRRFRDVSRAGGTDEVAAVLAQRVRAALRAGLEAAVEELALEEVLASPAVYLVRRAEKTSERDHSTQFDAALHEARGELDRFGTADDGSERDPDDAGLLVLAEEEIFDRVRERMKAILKNGGSSVAFYEKDGSESLDDFARVPAAVEVVRIEGDSTEIELRMIDLLQKLEELREDEEDDALVGVLFHEKYRIIRRIGKGGFGSVYEATDERGAGNRVAIKVMHPEKAASAAEFKSFKEEARRVTRLDHPNIVDWKVFDETPEGVQYFVMELLEGEELDRILAREAALEPMRAARILLGVLDALRAAHRLEGGSSILHLDLKPRNLFIVPAREGRPEQVKVFDFGIGQLVGGEEEHDDGGLAVAGDLHEAFDPDKSPSTINTRSSANAARWITDGEGRRFRRCVSCTPEYASPEQSGHILCLPEMVPLDGRSDLYSLGVAAFRMLTGEYPFPPPLERADLLRIHCEESFKKLVEADVKCPKPLARFVDRLLEKDREARFADADEAWRELDHFVNPPAWKRALPFAVPAAAALLALIVWLAARDTAAPRFAPRDAEHDVSLSSEPLYLGPARRKAVIELGPYDEGEGGLEDPGSVSVLRERDRSTFAGFDATWLGEDRIELAVEEDWPGFPGRLAETVLIAVDGASIDAFELRWLGPAAWTVEPARIGGRETREVAGTLAVDVHQQSLEIALAGSPELADDLEVLADVGGGERRVQKPERSGERLVSRFSLDELVPESVLGGELAGVRVTVSDRAGRVEVQTFAVAFVGTRLELALLDGRERLELLDRWRAEGSGDVALRKMGDRYVLNAKNQPRLLVEATSEADLHWWIELDGSGRRVLEERKQRQRTFRIDLDGLAELDEGRGYDATIHVELDDGGTVLRSTADRGRITGKIPFRYVDVQPSITASLARSADSSAPAQPLAAGRVDYFDARDAVLVIARDNDAQMRVVARVVKPDGSAIAFDPNDELRFPARREIEFPLAFAGDGRHAIVVETFFLDTLEGVAANEADWSATYEVVVDTVPPVIAFPAGTNGELVLRLSDVLERLDAVLPGHASAVGASPIELTARIADASGREVAHSRPQSISSGTDEVALELEAPWPGTQPAGGAAQSAAPDGAYRLFFDASDLAGNRAPSLVREIVLARAPPAIEIERPTEGRRWERRPDLWEVLIDAQDPNGLEAVECVVVRESDGQRIVVPLSFDPGATHAALEGALPFSHSWSEAAVRVEVVARDRYANEAPPTIASVRLPLIKPPEPERLGVVRAGFDVETMRLVRGNAALAYRFGGRANDVENELFRLAGLGERYRAGNEQAWAIEYPPGAIGEFYLDEREVGVGQFLAFVRADEGWNDARWWPRAPDASGPTPERRAELLATLAALDPELPVSDVTWDEACAYARFAGKRLPSWVEWEYAVRRGGEARLFAAWDSAQARPLPAAYRELNLPVIRGSAGNRSLEGLFDLDGNVSEWTSTPAWFVGAGTPPEGFREHLRRFWREALDPEASAPRLEPCPRFWYAGGSFDTRYHDFSVADRADRGTRSPSVGFRCALSLVQYHASLEAGSSLAGRFAPKDP